MFRAILLIGVAVTLGACIYRFGPQVEEFGPAQHPSGVTGQLRVEQRTMWAELLEVQDTALLVLTPRQEVALVPYHALVRGRFPPARITIGRSPTPRILNRLRLFSRFPQGLSPHLRRELLEAYGQQEVMVITQ